MLQELVGALPVCGMPESVSAILAVGIAPQLDALLKHMILGAVIVVLSVVAALLAIPIGVVIPWRFQKSKTFKRRIITGLLVAISAFVAVWIMEAIVVLLLVDKFLVR
jgi:hypothetical protein